MLREETVAAGVQLGSDMPTAHSDLVEVMPRASSSLAALAAVAATALTGATATGASPARLTKLSPPVVRETFSVLPCTGVPGQRSSLEEEGCAEHQILTTDRQINGLNRSIFAALRDDPARRRFIRAHAAWLQYREAYCQSQSDIFEGGTDAAVVDATCTAAINAQHVADLRQFAANLGAQ